MHTPRRGGVCQQMLLCGKSMHAGEPFALLSSVVLWICDLCASKLCNSELTLGGFPFPDRVGVEASLKGPPA